MADKRRPAILPWFFRIKFQDNRGQKWILSPVPHSELMHCRSPSSPCCLTEIIELVMNKAQRGPTAQICMSRARNFVPFGQLSTACVRRICPQKALQIRLHSYWPKAGGYKVASGLQSVLERASADNLANHRCAYFRSLGQVERGLIGYPLRTDAGGLHGIYTVFLHFRPEPPLILSK